MVLNYLLENKLDIDNIDINNIIAIPIEFERYYRERIKLQFNGSLRRLLEDILDKKLNNSYIEQDYGFRDLVIRLLGYGKFIEITDILSTIEKPNYKLRNDYINENNIKDEVYNYIKQLINNSSLTDRYGICNIEEFKLTIKEGQGFAEWWDKSFTGLDYNELVIYKNRDMLQRDNFLYTIIHEVYPGHAYYYKNKDIKDYWDFLKIEGYATYCEWNTILSEYSQAIKQRDLYILKESLTVKNKSFKKIYDLDKEIGFSEEQSMLTYFYLSQYIGFYELYYLGALLMELYKYTKC